MKPNLIDYEDERSLASRIRQKRFKKLIRLIEFASGEKGSRRRFRILDVGGTFLYWKMAPQSFLEEWNIEIVLLNLTQQPIPDDGVNFTSLVGDACNLQHIDDKEFNLVHSNSVIEHVGSWQNMRRMSSEMSRVGRALYVQTPYFWFPIEPHFLMPALHWLPMSLRYKLAMRMAMGNWPKARTMEEAIAAQQSAVLLDKSMFRELFPDCSIAFERFIGLPKSLIATRLC